MHAPGIVRSKVCWTGPSSDSPHGDDVKIVAVIAFLSLFLDSGHLCRDVRATPTPIYLLTQHFLPTSIDRYFLLDFFWLEYFRLQKKSKSAGSQMITRADSQKILPQKGKNDLEHEGIFRFMSNRDFQQAPREYSTVYR